MLFSASLTQEPTSDGVRRKSREAISRHAFSLEVGDREEGSALKPAPAKATEAAASSSMSREAEEEATAVPLAPLTFLPPPAEAGPRFYPHHHGSKVGVELLEGDAPRELGGGS